jgi:hypothetical protein
MGRLATLPLGIVSFLLTPQEPRRRIPATFSVRFWSTWAGADPSTREMARHSRGGKRAVFAGLDRSMHQSGVRGARPLAAGYRFRRRTLQQLQRSAPQCSAAAGPTHADASPLAGKLPSTRPLAGTTALVAASGSQGRSSASADEPSPQTWKGSSSTGAVACAVFSASRHPHPTGDRKTLTAPSRRMAVLPIPEMGRAAGGGPAARGAWANSKKCGWVGAIGTGAFPRNRSSTGRPAKRTPRCRLR